MTDSAFVAFRSPRCSRDAETLDQLAGCWGRPLDEDWILPFPAEHRIAPYRLSFAEAEQLRDIRVAPNTYALRFE